MSNHVTQVVALADGRWGGRCSCRHWSSKVCEHKWEVEDAIMKHKEQVERVKAHLSTPTPSLKQQHAYYLSQADPLTGNSEADRALWQQLADELGHRLNEHGNDDAEKLW